jgi:purine-binding chemotaxis protein CheW
MIEDRRTSLEHAAAELRRAFDQTFAEPPRSAALAGEGFLAVQVAGNAYALRLGEVAGLFKDRRVIPLPDAPPGMLGIGGFRGKVVPVYDLAALLGHGPARGFPRWLVLASAGEPVGLAFDAFEGLLSAQAEEGARARGDVRAHVSEALRAGGGVRPIVDVSSLVESVKRRARDGPARSGER